MSTWTEVTNYIKTQLRPGVLGNTTVQKILNSVLAIVNQINAGDYVPDPEAVWKADVTYPADTVPVIWQDRWLVSNVADNLGNVPISTAGVVHPTWRVIGSSAGSGIRIWEAIVYPNTLEVVFNAGNLYYLDRAIVGEDPFVSVDFANELGEEKWKVLTGSEGSSLPSNVLDALVGFGGTPGDENRYILQEGLTAILAGLELSSGARELNTDLIITSATAGTVTSSWIDHDGDTNSVTNQALTFAGAPSSGNFRYDWVAGNDDGTVSVVTGTPGAEGAVFPPALSGTQVGLRLILWNDAGTAQTSPPGQNNSGDFLTTRYGTAVAANTTGKFAKIWEGNLSKDQHFSIELSYNEPLNAITPYAGSGLRNLKVSFTCDSSRNIISATVQNQTDGGTAGEFVLYQISGNKAALYHKSNHYWGRIQFRVLFQNTSVRTQDFVNNAAYGSAPGSPVGTWASALVAGLNNDFIPKSGSTLGFDGPNKYGFNGTPLTGNLTFSVTDAKETFMIKARHNAGTAPTLTPPGGVTLIKEGGSYTVSVDNILYAICHKNDAGTVTHISYSWTKHNS